MSSLVDIAKETVAIAERGTYVFDGRVVNIRAAVDASVAGTKLYRPGEAPTYSRPKRSPRIEVTDEGTSGSARRLVGEGELVCALNFASAKNQGGGFLRGAKAQEEDLARCSALYASLLKAPEYYSANRANPSTIYTDHIIYSPDVPFFRDEALQLVAEPWNVSMITAPAPNAGEAREPRPVVEEALAARARLVLQVAAAHGHATLVLGAWGCGVFRNDPAVVADAFARWLPEFGFEHVVFAIYDRAKGQPNLAAFRRRFPVIESFVAAIRQALDDDGPRLVFADWLIARNDPRGEFIVLDCALAGGRAVAVEERRDELLRLHGPTWGAPLFALDASPDDEPRPDLRPTRFAYRRGCVQEVHYMGDDAAKLGALLRAEPIVSLIVSGPLGPLSVGAPELEWLRSLIITSSSGILASPHIGPLASLRFTREVDEVDAQLLAAGVARPVELLVTALPGGWAELTQEAAVTLAGSTALERVERLEADSAPLGALAGQLGALRHLRLRRGPVDAAALEGFTAHLGQLASIAIRVHANNEADVKRLLARHLQPACVRDLHIYGEDDGGPNFPF